MLPPAVWWALHFYPVHYRSVSICFFIYYSCVCTLAYLIEAALTSLVSQCTSMHVGKPSYDGYHVMQKHVLHLSILWHLNRYLYTKMLLMMSYHTLCSWNCLRICFCSFKAYSYKAFLYNNVNFCLSWTSFLWIFFSIWIYEDGSTVERLVLLYLGKYSRRQL